MNEDFETVIKRLAKKAAAGIDGLTISPLITPTVWSGEAIKLLEATHGQWLYRCVKTHDNVAGTSLAKARKEQLQLDIERQQDMGIGDNWEREDQYLVEVNLEDLESTSGYN